MALYKQKVAGLVRVSLKSLFLCIFRFLSVIMKLYILMPTVPRSFILIFYLFLYFNGHLCFMPRF